MKIIKNKYGFYELNKKPNDNELHKYYAEKYYQQDMALHKKTYSKIELEYIENKIKQKYHLIKNRIDENRKLKLLDVGCGEGYTLKFFKNMGWLVKGVDYSKHGIEMHNPDCLEDFEAGDIYDNLNEIVKNNVNFDLIWLDNVLEHVIEPLDLIRTCHLLCKKGGLLIIEVPNDFSKVQNQLKDESLVEKDYWVALPDHLSYFNLKGLKNLVEEANWIHYDSIADFPIEFNLFNPNANYVKDKSKGKGSHLQRLKVENLMNNISVEKTIEIYRILAQMGLGRQIISVFFK